jgi:hypothetical protein
MMTNFSGPVLGFAFDPTVRRAIQNLPQHQVMDADDRFEQLLERLSEAESNSASPSCTREQGAGASAVAVTCTPPDRRIGYEPERPLCAE